MKNGQPEHYWRIHARIARRILTDLPPHIRHVIASDVSHTTEHFKWFHKKVNDDAQRLFEDPAHYDNQAYTFRVPKDEARQPSNPNDYR